MLESRVHDFGYFRLSSVQQHGKEKRDNKDIYCTVGAVTSKSLPLLSP